MKNISKTSETLFLMMEWIMYPFISFIYIHIISQQSPLNVIKPYLPYLND